MPLAAASGFAALCLYVAHRPALMADWDRGRFTCITERINFGSWNAVRLVGGARFSSACLRCGRPVFAEEGQ